MGELNTTLSAAYLLQATTNDVSTSVFLLTLNQTALLKHHCGDETLSV